MQIKETAKKGLNREYTITVPAADIAAQTEAQLKQIGQTAKISGFRPGHIPANILKQRYGQSVMGEVLEKSVHTASHKVIEEKKLRPAVQPDIKVTSFEEGKDLVFEMKVEIFPEVPEVDVSKIKVTKPTFDIAEKEIKDALGQLAERNKVRKPKADSAKAAKGDVVRIDFKGMRDGVAFEGGTAENFNLELGSGQFIPGFEDQLIGTKKGDEVKVDVTFPKEYHSAELAGQPVVFEVKVHEVQGSETPKPDDEFAKNIGFENLEALKNSLKEHIGKDYLQYARNKVKKDLFDQLEDACTFDVPDSMVENEFKGIWAKLKEAQAQGDESVAGRDDKDLEKEYRGIALRRVRLGIFLAEYGRKQKVEVSQQELMNAVVEQARMFPGQEQKVVEFYQQNPNHIEELRGPIFEDKVVDVLLEKVKVTEKKTSLEDLIKEDDASAKKPAAKKKAAEKKPAAKKTTAKKAPAKKPAAKKPAAKKAKK